MKKLLELYKNFKYKTITSILLTIIFQVIFRLTDFVIFNYISLIFFAYMIVNVIIGIFYGIKNTYIQGDKIQAIIFGIISVLFFLGLGFVIVYFGILGN